MDRNAIEATRALYDGHANVHRSTNDALRARQQGEALPLKKFHNDVKRQLINEFAQGAGRLLDLCCGRGGDIHKWMDADVGYVLGLDLSPGEIVEATRRFSEASAQAGRRRGGPPRLQAEFRQTDDIGLANIPHDAPFDVVTCMFAAHYFFVSEAAFRQFLSNVSSALRVGGHFFGTLPDGKRILKGLNQKQVFESPMLRLEACFPGGRFQNFGSPYKCAITDTVTEGEDGGSYEYLVFFTAFREIAKEYGLRAVRQYKSPALVGLLEGGDEHAEFKHFCPSFPNSHPSLEIASALNCTFVFQKVEEARGAPPPSAQPAAGVKREREEGGGGGGGKKAKEPAAEAQAGETDAGAGTGAAGAQQEQEAGVDRGGDKG